MDEEQTLSEALAAEFDKQTAETPENEVEETIEATAEETEVVEESSEEAEVTEVSPPEHWSEEDQAIFMELDERGREFALSREKQFDRGIEEKSNELKTYREAFEPYKHLIPPGMSEAQVVQQLLNAQALLQRNPQEGIRWLMQSYGVDEKQFAPTEAPTTTNVDDVYVDPQVKELQDRIDALTSDSEQKAQQAEIDRQNAMLAEIARFRDETDDDGNLTHPQFNNVYGVMAGLLQSGSAKDMQEAYDKAVWAVPEYRESEVERKAREFAEKQLAEKQADAEKAAKASKTVTGKKSAKTAPKEKTLKDSLSENYEKSIRGEL